jgi:hypothetical protein
VQRNDKDHNYYTKLARSCNLSKLTGGIVVVVVDVDVDVVGPAVVNAVVGTIKISVDSSTVESAAFWSLEVTVAVTTKGEVWTSLKDEPWTPGVSVSDRLSLVDCATKNWKK